MKQETLLRVFDHAQYVDSVLAQKKEYVRIATFLVGSQNYGIDTETSDVDTISICAPTFMTAALNKEHIATTLITPADEHAVVKDVRDYIKDGLKKQNVNFVETLFTEYVDVAPEWVWVYDELLQLREMIAHYSKFRTIHAACGMITRRNKTAIDEIHQDYDGKQVCTIFRLWHFLRQYLSGHPYEECINIPRHYNMELALKRHEVPFDTAKLTVETFNQNAVELLEKWRDVPVDTDGTMDAILDDLVIRIMKQEWCVNE